MKRIVHTVAFCADTLLEVAAKGSPAALKAHCEISPGSEVTILDGPVTILDASGGSSEIVKVRYYNSTGDPHEGWILYSSIK